MAEVERATRFLTIPPPADISAIAVNPGATPPMQHSEWFVEFVIKHLPLDEANYGLTEEAIRSVKGKAEGTVVELTENCHAMVLKCLGAVRDGISAQAFLVFMPFFSAWIRAPKEEPKNDKKEAKEAKSKGKAA